MADLLQVRIVSPRETLFEGQAESVSSVNSVGAFDILPEHAKFITVVENKPLLLRLPGNVEKEFKFALAIIHAYEGKVVVYTEPQEVTFGFTGLAKLPRFVNINNVGDRIKPFNPVEEVPGIKP